MNLTINIIYNNYNIILMHIIISINYLFYFSYFREIIYNVLLKRQTDFYTKIV